MRLNSKMTWGLAWAGLAVVVAVPSLDFITGKAGGKTAAVVTSTTDPVLPAKAQPAATVKTAAVTTKVSPHGITITPAGASASSDPVNNYLKANKSLPDYISDSTTASSGSATSESSTPTKVATIDPVPPPVAPVPFPARPPDALAPAAPSATPPVTTASTDALMSTPPSPPVAAPKLYAPAESGNDVAPPQEADADPTAPVPPATIDDGSDWQGQGLQRYLRRNGLLSDGAARSTASVTIVNRDDPNYDPDGFYLSNGPNDLRAHRRARIDRMLEQQQEQNDGGWLPNFSLF